MFPATIEGVAGPTVILDTTGLQVCVVFAESESWVAVIVLVPEVPEQSTSCVVVSFPNVATEVVPLVHCADAVTFCVEPSE